MRLLALLLLLSASFAHAQSTLQYSGSASSGDVTVHKNANWGVTAMPDCQDTGGQHLNFRLTNHTFSCGTSSSIVLPDWASHSTATGCQGGGCTWAPSVLFRYWNNTNQKTCFWFDIYTGDDPSVNSDYLTLSLPFDIANQAGNRTLAGFFEYTYGGTTEEGFFYMLDNLDHMRLYRTGAAQWATGTDVNGRASGCYESD